LSGPAIPESLPLVLRPSRAGTFAAAGAGVLFLLVGLFFAAAGNMLVAIFALALAAVGLFAAVVGVLPRRSELRLDEQGLEVVSPVKRWKAGWDEIERFEVARVPMGRSTRGPVIRVVYGEAFDAGHTSKSALGKALGVDEHFVVPAYGNLNAEQLSGLLSRFRERYGGPAPRAPGSVSGATEHSSP
jgi:hypothetical protein